MFAVPHERWGETPMAVCRVATRRDRHRRGDHRAGASAPWAPTRSPGPSSSPTEPLPKNVVGKLLRKALREPHWAGQASRVAGA